MPFYPRPDELGSLLSIPAARGTGRYGNGTSTSDDDPIAAAPDDVPPVDVGARSGQSDFGQTDFGQPDQEKEEAVARTERQHDLTEAISANAFIHGRLIEARARYRSDPSFATLTQRWSQDSTNIVIAGLNRISNDDLRQHVRSTLEAPLDQERAAISDQAFRGAGEDHAASRDKYLGSLVQNITLNPNDALLDGGINVYHSAIDNAVQHGYVTPEDALAEKRHAALELCAAHYSLLGRVDPARALDELESGNNAHPLAQFLPDETKDALIAQTQANQRADQLDAAEADRLQRQATQRASDEAETAILKDRLGDNPTVTAKTISNNRALTADAKDRMLSLVQRADQPEPPAQVSNAAAVDPLNRIRRPDGDDQKIASTGPIVDAYNDSELSKADFTFVQKQLADAGMPGGDVLAKDKQA